MARFEQDRGTGYYKLAKRVLYEYATGRLLWAERPAEDFATTGACKAWNRRFAYTQAGTACRSGVVVRFMGDGYSAARLCVLIGQGILPDRVHFRDGNSDNLAAANLEGQFSDTCYQCLKKVGWLAPDSRCSECTRCMPEEV